jgi:hypothetical protein
MVTLYFTLPLKKRTMYIANLHAADPTKLQEWKVDDGERYIRKILASESNTVRQKKLMNLYKNSVSKLKDGEWFFIFQQVAIKNNFSLKTLVAISFSISSKFATNNNIKRVHTLIKKIKTKYPNVQIKIINTD